MKHEILEKLKIKPVNTGKNDYSKLKKYRKLYINFIASQLLEFKNIEDIASMLNINRNRLYDYDLVNPARKVVEQQLEDRILKVYFTTNSVRETKKICGPTRNVRKVLQKYHIMYLPPANKKNVLNHLNGEYLEELTPLQVEFIEGSLLGDLYLKTENCTKNSYIDSNYFDGIKFIKEIGNISEMERFSLVERYNNAINAINVTGTAHFAYGKSILETSWIQALDSNLNLKFKCSFSKAKETKKVICLARTKSNIYVYQIFKKWYGSGKKILPNDVKLTPFKLLLWFIDDGTTNNNRINLLSLNFTEQENVRLKNMLYDTFGIRSKVRLTNYEGYDKDYFYIDISEKDNIKKFYKTMAYSPRSLYDVAKIVFPWKFDLNLRKVDFIDTIIKNYSSTERNTLIIPTSSHSYKKDFINVDGHSYGKNVFIEVFQ